MTIQHDTALILLATQEYLKKHPNRLIGSTVFNDQLIWIKRRPFSKKKGWHTLQGYISHSIRMPILSPTVTSGGAESLFEEGERLRLFAAKGISVPKVLAITKEFIVTEDAGYQLQRHLKKLSDSDEIHRILNDAARALNQLHRQGLCHARPSLRDMTILNGVISFIDLEENPLNVMSLSEAQARDIWLFLNSAARYCKDDPALLMSLFQTYQQDISQDTLHALQKLVKCLKPFRFVAEFLLTPILGKDGLRAIKANKMLEQSFA